MHFDGSVTLRAWLALVVHNTGVITLGSLKEVKAALFPEETHATTCVRTEEQHD